MCRYLTTNDLVYDRMNFLQLNILIDYDWLNLSLDTFKLRCKSKFLDKNPGNIRIATPQLAQTLLIFISLL